MEKESELNNLTSAPYESSTNSPLKIPPPRPKTTSDATCSTSSIPNNGAQVSTALLILDASPWLRWREPMGAFTIGLAPGWLAQPEQVVQVLDRGNAIPRLPDWFVPSEALGS
ncbi:MAG: hypothetical protein ACK506_25795 [Pirellula sp.]